MMGSGERADEGPESCGVRHINAYGEEHFGGVLHCSWSDKKGRIVTSNREYNEGDVIFAEPPLHIAQEADDNPAFQLLKQLCTDHEEDFDYEPLWYWCAIQSLTPKEIEGAKVAGITGATPEKQHNLLLLHHEEVTEPTGSAAKIVELMVPNADPIVVERLTQVWILNCFEYSDDPEGYSTYFFSSFMSHSCQPNAIWHYTGEDHVLRCRRRILAGDEVCITYLPEGGLLQPATSRRMELFDTKRFWCDCERCGEGKTDHTRGMRCPSCREGIVFARTPKAEPAKTNALLAAHFTNLGCSSETCGASMSQSAAKRLNEIEHKLQKVVEKYEGGKPKATVDKVEEDLKFVDQHFGQHSVADLAWEQFAKVYGTAGMGTEQRDMLRRRCKFHETAYDGLTGAHAWALEALGDCLLVESQAKSRTNGSPKGSQKGASSGRPVCKADPKGAAMCFQHALRVLRPLFGDEHEYVESVEVKLAAVPPAVP